MDAVQALPQVVWPPWRAACSTTVRRPTTRAQTAGAVHFAHPFLRAFVPRATPYGNGAATTVERICELLSNIPAGELGRPGGDHSVGGFRWFGGGASEVRSSQYLYPSVAWPSR